MFTGNRYLHALASKPTWLLAPDDGSGAGGDGSGDDGDGDGDDSDDDSDDDDGSDSFAELDSVVKELGLSPGQLAERLKASRKWENRSKAARAAIRELEELKKSSLPPDERAVQEAEERGRTAARAENAQLLAGARIEAALTGVVDDPADIVEDLNLAKFVTDENEVDVDAIDELKKKYSARMGASNDEDDDADGDKPKRKADLKQGKRGKSGAGTPEQLTRDWLAGKTPEQIEAARLAGQLNDVLGIKT